MYDAASCRCQSILLQPGDLCMYGDDAHHHQVHSLSYMRQCLYDSLSWQCTMQQCGNLIANHGTSV